MKAVILAAGNGTRLKPLTDVRPKPLVPILNKSILEWNLDVLQGLVEEVIIVINSKGDLIKEQIGEVYNGMKITYVGQKEQRGTGDALLVCEGRVEGRFVVLNGDDIFSKEDVEKCLAEGLCVLGTLVEDPERWGILESKDGFLVTIDEKPDKPKSNLANVGLYVLDDGVFTVNRKVSARGEIEITQLVNEMVHQGKKFVVKELSGYWLPVSYPWGVLEANAACLERMKGEIEGEVEVGATLKGEVSVGRGTLVKAGAYIEGPVCIGRDCVIGPNCFIRAGTTLGDVCRVGNAVEIKNCVLFSNVSVGHLSYLGDSVIGEHTNIGAGTITANLRHDNENVKVKINGGFVDSCRRKLGAVIGAHAHTGVHTSLYPGRVIAAHGQTLPGEVVK